MAMSGFIGTGGRRVVSYGLAFHHQADPDSPFAYHPLAAALLTASSPTASLNVRPPAGASSGAEGGTLLLRSGNRYRSLAVGARSA